MPERLYLDNAATSFPKPPEVLEAMRAYAEELGASAGRGAYREAVDAGVMVAECRRRLARLIGCEPAKNVVFALNCSEALNLAIKGVLRDGDHVVTTVMDHNSVLRPLNALQDRGRNEVTFVPADAETGAVRADDVLAAIRPRTRLVCMTHGSNVTGTLQPIDEVAEELRRREIFLLVDSAQTVGHVPLDVAQQSIDFLAMPGHKGLMGPLGTGALYIRPGLENVVEPLIEGGTGSVSELATQPDFMPDRFESGSHNAIGLAGLGAALAWIEERSVKSLRAHDLALSTRFLEKAAEIEPLRVFGPRDAASRVAVFSVRMEGLEPAELSALLETEFAILSRSGLHCAPLAHQTLGTHETGGTTRLSFGAYNTLDDVDRCVHALAQLAGAGARA